MTGFPYERWRRSVFELYSGLHHRKASSLKPFPSALTVNRHSRGYLHFYKLFHSWWFITAVLVVSPICSEIFQCQVNAGWRYNISLVTSTSHGCQSVIVCRCLYAWGLPTENTAPVIFWLYVKDGGVEELTKQWKTIHKCDKWCVVIRRSSPIVIKAILYDYRTHCEEIVL